MLDARKIIYTMYICIYVCRNVKTLSTTMCIGTRANSTFALSLSLSQFLRSFSYRVAEN